MHYFTADRIVGYSPKQMFNIVADVEKYPEFVPLCKELIIDYREKIDTNTVIIASMKIRYMGMQEILVTKVTIKKDQNRIVVEHVKNLFNFLENHWYFEDSPNGGCIVHFSIKYELKNRIFDMMLRKIFDRSFRYFAKAFEKRAQTIYNTIMHLSYRK
ncbi:type II toxin-antitoxin system RatA family toxin [Candidatus Liberibacter americanus]|uniref:Oligoketide cyclase/lipid transport protein n=1 Tax=Candidatus Liberibacter americanus str. Sao Paulo TaxID=1261131 RepID=U6B458_9HYPH|nr:type II toxin-antitoxin system RatA family toxin [Candidatus Liberibacter americanus]AHA27685.1 Oligoketide cyclase/lipid transport protein [Candidatus Liberibacter americanus str. Sao Paulo]EMS36392.1 hypothetical protein G653_01913 [Candidatus Liberibacter americanus PW_SP]